MSVSKALHDLVVAKLKAAPAVAALVGSDVFDSVPAAKKDRFPRISMGAYDFVADDADCIFAGDHTLLVDIWSREVGSVEAKSITDAVRRAIRNIGDVDLPDYGLVEITADSARVFADPDGKTTHGVVQVEARIEEPE